MQDIIASKRGYNELPSRDLTPEHTKRGGPVPPHPDVQAAYDYVCGVRDVSDLCVGEAPAWHGWAIREAFLAGISHAEQKRAAEQVK